MSTIGRGQTEDRGCHWYRQDSWIGKHIALLSSILLCCSINRWSVAATIIHNNGDSPQLSGNMLPIRNVSCVAYNTRYNCDCRDEEHQVCYGNSAPTTHCNYLICLQLK